MTCCLIIQRATLRLPFTSLILSRFYAEVDKENFYLQILFFGLCRISVLNENHIWVFSCIVTFSLEGV
jgi:hypothetical protein